LFQSIDPREMEMGGISWRCLKVTFCFIVIQSWESVFVF
jgi:hypothetical protein